MENQRSNRGGFDEEEEEHGGFEIELPLPPGFRFHPTDEELISHYLTNKALNASFSATAIGDVDLNKCEPWDLPLMAKMGEKEWYFFCVRDRKYPTGLRTNRATQSGYWKATGKDKEICSSSRGINNKSIVVVGMKKTLVFYQGRAPKGEKSNWVMHEYRLEGNFKTSPAQNEWVICRVFEKSSSSGGGAGNNKIHVVNSTGGPNYFENNLMMNPSSPLLPPLMESSPLKQQNIPCFLSEPIRIPSFYEDQQQSYLKALFATQGGSQEIAGSQSLEIGGRTAINGDSNHFISCEEIGNLWNY